MAYKIVYKAVSAILCVCVLPLAIFSPMIQIVGDVSFAQTFIGEDVSLYDIYALFFKRGTTFSGFGDTMTEEVRATMPELITAGSFLALTVLLGISGACVAIFCKKKLPTLLVSAAGCLSVVGLFVSFKQFAVPYLDGTIDIGKLGLMEEGILESIFSALIQLRTLQISSAGFLMFGAFLCTFLWTGAFMLVEMGETPKKVRK